MTRGSPEAGPGRQARAAPATRLAVSPTGVGSLRIALTSLAAVGLLVGVLFLPAGRLDWVAGWQYVGLLVLQVAFQWACLRRYNPELIERRMQIGEGTKTWDKVWGALYAPVFLSIYVVAGLDAGRSADPSAPWAPWLAGLLLMLSGTALLTWSMLVNPFFEKTVRIQRDRGHRVIDTGPYAYVRHPGYVGFSGWMLSTPLLLASWWALLPSLLAVLGLVVRTALEDRVLREELEGYAGYARRVVYRLVPGIW